MRLSQGLTLLATLLVLQPLSAAPPDSADHGDYYDELYSAPGQVRPQYAAVHSVYRQMTPAQVQEFVDRSKAKHLFNGDNSLDPLPRLLTRTEFDELKRGVEQRGNALRLFLQDYFSGHKTYERGGVIPEPIVRRIVGRAGERRFAGLVKPDQVSFIYGPDIVRAKNGKWYVIEDNPGFVGGVGDLKVARKALLELQPKYREVLKPRSDPDRFYSELVRSYRERAVPHGGKVVLYMVPPYPDNEDSRMARIFKDLGVEIVTPGQKRLVVKPEGVYLRKSGMTEATERVGFLFLNGEHKWIDATHPAAECSARIFEANALLEEDELKPQARRRIEAALVPLERTGEPDQVRLKQALARSGYVDQVAELRASSPAGLLQAILDGKVAANYAPGLDFIGDKEFNTYVDDLVRFYLHEEPILPSLPTLKFTGEQVIDQVFSGGRYRNFVIKKVDGRGGDGIYIGPKLKESEIPEILARVRAHPDRYIAQPFTPLSRLGESIVDLRLIADVSPTGTHVSEVPWGRGISVDGDGKVNLSGNGKEFAVVVVEDPGVVECTEAGLENRF